MRLLPLLAAILLAGPGSGRAETPETILIRATLANELAGHRRAEPDLALAAYDADAVRLDGHGNADPRAWTYVADERDALAARLRQDLESYRYDVERTLPLIAVRGAQAMVISIDSGLVTDRRGVPQSTGSIRRWWLLRKVEKDWRIALQVDGLGDSLLALPAGAGTVDAEVAAALAAEKRAWETADAGALAGVYDESLLGMDGVHTARPETWRLLFAGLDEWRLYLQRRLANVSYTLDRQVLYAQTSPGRRQAVALTSERLTTRLRAGDQVESLERQTLWLLVRRGGDWKVHTFCYAFRLP
jgi:hypothetical protein